MRATPIEGGCLCGSIRYRASGGHHGSMICHCRTCRRLSGAPVVAWLSLLTGQFRITRGKPVAFHSSPDVTRTFCAACGTPLTYQRADTPDEIDVTTCTLDAPERFPPTHHSWMAHDLDWVSFGDGLPTFRQSRNDS
jgi:hypothetical protein